MSAQKKEVVLAGGCFWGMEELFRNLVGVEETEVGYAGGTAPDPTYDVVKLGSSGHAEAIKLVFDPNIISLKEIYHFFFKIHDPTTLNRQGNDRGTQYRSAIFYNHEDDKKVAEEVIQEVQETKRFSGDIVTQLESLESFYSAEPEHQKYLQRNPGGYTCHYIRD